MLLQIAQAFERSHHDIRIEFVDLSNNYYKDALFTALDPKQPTVDLVEADTVFLQDLIDKKLIEALPDDVLGPDGTFLPVASMAAKSNGITFGVPHWVCGNFLFFRKDDPAVDLLMKTTTLSELEHILNHPSAEKDGLLADMKGKSTLGEIYLSSLIDEYPSSQEALAHLGSPTALDPIAAGTASRIFRLCPGGLNHVDKYHLNGQFYSRQFAHCYARAKISYSEDLYYVGDEFLHGVVDKPKCSTGDPTKDDIRAIGAPLGDKKHKMLAWVDAMCLRSGLDEQTKRDAMDFVSAYTGEEFNRKVLTPAAGDAPRYLLPARAALYTDSTVVQLAPLYPRLKAIIQDAVTVTAPNLNNQLRAIGDQLDQHIEDLPAPKK